jgi:hypothetical protein
MGGYQRGQIQNIVHFIDYVPFSGLKAPRGFLVFLGIYNHKITTRGVSKGNTWWRQGGIQHGSDHLLRRIEYHDCLFFPSY